MAKQARPIPDVFHTVTPHLVLREAGYAIVFYKKGYGAEEDTFRPRRPQTVGVLGGGYQPS